MDYMAKNIPALENLPIEALAKCWCILFNNGWPDILSAPKLRHIDNARFEIKEWITQRVGLRTLSLYLKEQRDKQCKIISVDRKLIPDGAELIECYRFNGQIIVCGDPDNLESHNCDQMGCTTASHVLYKFNYFSLTLRYLWR